MSYSRILLVNPPYRGARVKVVFSAGLGYVAEALGSAGFEYDVLDMSLGYAYGGLKRKINAFKPDLIGMSMMTRRYKDTYQLIRSLKSDYPNVSIVVGGPHISLFRKKVMQDCPEIDFGIVLEGEEALVELCRGDNIDSIRGLFYKGGHGAIYNGDRDFIGDLDAIHFPKYEKFELDKSFNKEVSALPIVSSRGCPFECIYCPVKCSIGANFRVRSPQNIVDELRYWRERGYRNFSFADDNFTLVKDRVYELCELLKNSKMKDLRLSCDNGIRADRVDRDLLKLMKEVGFHRIAFGVEAGNDKVLRMLRKAERVSTITKRISEACDLGYEVNLFFLVGSPGETLQDLDDSFNIALSHPIGIANFYNIIPFPNTELFSWIEKNGRFLQKPEEYLNNYPIFDDQPVFDTPQLPEDMRKKALRKAFSVMRMTMRRSWQKRLARLGFLGALLSFIYTTKFVQDVLLRNKTSRRLVYCVADKFIR